MNKESNQSGGGMHMGQDSLMFNINGVTFRNQLQSRKDTMNSKINRSSDPDKDNNQNLPTFNL